MKNDRLISAAIIGIIACSILSYFVRPKAPQLELVTPKQELSSFSAQYPGDMRLADRVIKSYELAFILVSTPYMSTNVTALEAVREWAREQFQAHPDFLHPVALAGNEEHHDTVFGALGYNLFAAGKYWLEGIVGEALRGRIAEFHKTSAYQSFNTAYFDFFGRTADAATLLARYESDRAKTAVDVVLWSIVWLVAGLSGTAALVRSSDFFTALRRVTAGAWSMLALAYLSQAWATGHAASLLSMLVAGAIAYYLFRPFLLVSHHEARQRLVQIHLAPCWIATAAWFTFSCVAIQILTWMRTGIPTAPDPVSLFLGSVTGNFLQDPVIGKHVVSYLIVGSWLLVSVWALRQRSKDQPVFQEPDSHFEMLNTTVSFDRVS